MLTNKVYMHLTQKKFAFVQKSPSPITRTGDHITSSLRYENA